MNFLIELFAYMFIGQLVGIYLLNSGGGRSDEPKTKKKLPAVLLAYFLGAVGVHKLYLGQKKGAIAMLCTSFLGPLLMGIIILLSGALGVQWLLDDSVASVVICLPTLAMSILANIEAIVYVFMPREVFVRRYSIEGRQWF